MLISRLQTGQCSIKSCCNPHHKVIKLKMDIKIHWIRYFQTNVSRRDRYKDIQGKHGKTFMFACIFSFIYVCLIPQWLGRVSQEYDMCFMIQRSRVRNLSLNPVDPIQSSLTCVVPPSKSDLKKQTNQKVHNHICILGSQSQIPQNPEMAICNPISHKCYVHHWSSKT